MEKPDEILELYKYIEANFDVKKIRYKGVLFWPIMRLELGFELILKKAPIQFLDHSSNRDSILKWLIHFPYRLLKFFLIKRSFTKSIYKSESDFLFCTSPNALFIDHINGLNYSRYIDPYYEVIEKYYNVDRVSFEKKDNNVLNTYHKINFTDYELFHKYNFLKRKLLEIFNYKKAAVEDVAAMKMLEDLNDEIEKRYNIRPVNKGILNRVNEYIINYDFFNIFIEKNKHLKAIFMEGFYCVSKMPLVFCAREKGIKVIEIQHGGAEDNVYVPYANKQFDFKMIPDYLWCWSQSDKDLILEHNGELPFLKPFVGGNMWMKKFKNNEIKIENKEDANFIDSINSKNNILICLQPFIGLTDIMLEVINKHQFDFYFLIRIHPFTRDGELAEIQRKLEGFKNVETYFSSKINLYHLFNCVQFQITHSSTTAMESLSFNLPTIVCSEFGHDYYKNQIEKKVMHYAVTIEDIDEILLANIQLDFEKAEVFKIQTSEQLAIDNLKVVLAQ